MAGGKAQPLIDTVGGSATFGRASGSGPSFKVSCRGNRLLCLAFIGGRSKYNCLHLGVPRVAVRSGRGWSGRR